METGIITNEQLKDLSGKLKTYFSNWAALMAESISKDKDWKNWTNNPCTEQNTRNIASGIINGQRHRRIFMRIGAKMLLDAIQQNTKIKNSIEEIK